MPLTQDQETCLDCKTCCKFLVQIQACKDKALYNDTVQFYSNWGCVVLKYDDGVRFEVAIPYPCRYLTSDGCRVYEERPKICRNNEVNKRGAFFKRNCKNF